LQSFLADIAERGQRGLKNNNESEKRGCMALRSFHVELICLVPGIIKGVARKMEDWCPSVKNLLGFSAPIFGQLPTEIFFRRTPIDQ
jgi:hypothetical protein